MVIDRIFIIFDMSTDHDSDPPLVMVYPPVNISASTFNFS
jgi:hypothetical protein